MDAVHIEAKEALTTLLKHLNRFHTILTKHGMDPDIIAQIFKQVNTTIDPLLSFTANAPTPVFQL